VVGQPPRPRGRQYSDAGAQQDRERKCQNAKLERHGQCSAQNFNDRPVLVLMRGQVLIPYQPFGPGPEVSLPPRLVVVVGPSLLGQNFRRQLLSAAFQTLAGGSHDQQHRGAVHAEQHQREGEQSPQNKAGHTADYGAGREAFQLSVLVWGRPLPPGRRPASPPRFLTFTSVRAFANAGAAG